MQCSFCAKEKRDRGKEEGGKGRKKGERIRRGREKGGKEAKKEKGEERI